MTSKLKDLVESNTNTCKLYIIICTYDKCESYWACMYECFINAKPRNEERNKK